MKDVIITGVTPSDISLPIDVVLLTVTDCEFLACYRLLINPFRCWFDDIGYVYFGSEGEGQEEGVKTAVVRCWHSSMGKYRFMVTALKVALELRPKAVVSVGTCSSLKPKKVKLGDVVVSTMLHELSTGMRGYVSERFLRLTKHVAEGFEAPLQERKHFGFEVHCGEFLCASEQDFSGARRNQQADYSQAIAIMTEGEGELFFFTCHFS